MSKKRFMKIRNTLTGKTRDVVLPSRPAAKTKAPAPTVTAPASSVVKDGETSGKNKR